MSEAVLRVAFRKLPRLPQAKRETIVNASPSQTANTEEKAKVTLPKVRFADKPEAHDEARR